MALTLSSQIFFSSEVYPSIRVVTFLLEVFMFIPRIRELLTGCLVVEIIIDVIQFSLLYYITNNFGWK